MNVFIHCVRKKQINQFIIPTWCIATQGGKIIACGHNNNRCYTHNEQFLNNAYMYAEIIMIKLYNKFIKI